MADFPTFADLFALARNEMLARSSLLARQTIDREGSDVNVLVAAATAAADEVVGQLINVSAGLYLDTATDTALDRLLFDRYGLARKVAASGVTSLVFSTATPAVASFTIPANTRVQTADGIVYETIQPETFAVGATSLYAIAKSILAGANQQVKPDTLTSLVGTVSGAPADLVVTNPLASTGAADVESDDSFRERGRAYFTTARRGTLKAIEQGALTVPGVIRAAAFEIIDLSGRPAKFVTVAIADQYTDTLAQLTSATSPTYAAQSEALSLDVFNALQDYRAGGIYVQVQVAQVILLPIQLSLSFQAGVNIDAVALSARSAMVAYVNALNPGQDLDPADLVAVLRKVSGLVVTGNEISSPPGVVVANPLQVLRSTLSIVSASNSSPGTPIGNYTNPDQAQVA